ncbi:DUF5675 family protein [Algoriphagus halophilus]|uniref:DUF5675 family protein n=1 Tax=Algoriphagus halophilus TaxID=226505 RepID=UPI00358DDD1B
MNRLILNREVKSLIQTQGRFRLMDKHGQCIYECYTLELPWMDNQVGKSCIPPGEYRLAHRRSPKYGDHIHVMEVPGRSYILIHPANFVTQLRGCIAVGEKRMDINGDGVPDVANSRKALERLLPLISNGDKLIVL